MKRLVSFPPVLFLSLSMTFLSACGAFQYDEKETKEYRLYIHDDNSDVQSSFHALIDEFNQRADRIVLTYVDNKNDANCNVTLTPGLQDRDGKVGWGQMLRETKQESPVQLDPTKKPKRELIYSMRLEFDKAFYYNRMKFEDDDKRTQLLKLFSHEVGHGLEMGHDPSNPKSVMYPDISGDKDFDAFFERVRAYF